ncbi:MAG: large-conductance mechanosensitive channel protein MscL [Xanthomonadaceae bacterium]|nr:large-conductance mechanosensitive channel protein MscL [Xanthomonadaceae bacterium]
MGMVTEFRDFAMRGNVIDLAVGVVIGGAFGKIVGSLVEKIIMPPIGLLIGGVDFSDIAITLREAAGETPAVAIGIGDFINTLIQFVIVAFAIFMVIKAINATKRKQEAAPPPPEPSEEVRLLTEIRDALRNR